MGQMIPMLRDAVEAGKVAYAAAVQRRADAQEAVLKARGVVADAQAKHDALRQQAIEGKPVTADQLGAALHKIAGAQSLVAIQEGVVTAREADMEVALQPVLSAMRKAMRARIEKLNEQEKALRGQIDFLHGRLNVAFQASRSAEYMVENLAIKDTALCSVSALKLIEGGDDGGMFDVPGEH